VDNPIFGKQVADLANSAMKVVQQNAEEIKNMAPGEERNQSLQYLVDLAEQGSKMVSYKIVEYQNALTGKYSGETINLAFK
jgi:hypothetical protein